MFSTQSFKDSGQYRELRDIEQHGAFLDWNGKRYLNLSSNDYLGISARLDLQKEFLSALVSVNSYITGSLSSRLLTGNDPVYSELENYIASQYGRSSCLLFNSGYHANLGVLPALSGKKDLILADKLVHASIIDGLRLCEARWIRYKHNDYEDLERLLTRHREDYERVFIITESVFSMDGDRANLERLVEIKKRFNALLYLDEAHAIGVFGKHGLGLAEQDGFLNDIDLHMCTLGKAVASEGAFLLSSLEVRDYLINTCRSLIFTTGIPPLQVRWTRFILEKIITMKKEREHLHDITRQFREKMKDMPLLGDTHIIPLLIGDNKACSAFAEHLRAGNIWAMPVRYPTVPFNQARIRFSLTAALTTPQIDTLCELILSTH